MNWNAKIYTEPTVEPVSLDEFKAYARITATDEDQNIQSTITAARKYCERYTRRQFCEATWKLYLDAMPLSGYAIELPNPPLLSVTTFQYVDTDNTTQTWSSAEYVVDTSSAYGRVYEHPDYRYPIANTVRNAVIITYKCGYGTTAASVPPDICMAIKLLALHWYENREAVVVGVVPQVLQFGLDNLLQSYMMEEPAL